MISTHTLSKVLTWFLIGLFCCGIGIYWFLHSLCGINITIYLLQHMLAGNLSVATVKGKLSSNIMLKQLRYFDNRNGQHIIIDHLQVSYHISWWPHLALHFTNVEASGVKIHLASDHNEGQTTIHPQMLRPWMKIISLDHIQIAAIFLRMNEKSPFMIQQILWDRQSNSNNHFQLLSDLGNFDGNLYLTTHKELKWYMTVNASQLNPGYLASEWQGNISFKAMSTGIWHGPLSDIIFQLIDLKGRLHHLPLTGTATIHLNHHSLILKNTDIRFGRAYLHASGILNHNTNILLSLDIPQLKDFSPIFSGRLQANGHIAGTIDTPILNTTIKLNQLSSSFLKASSIEASANITTNKIPTATLKLYGNAVTAQDVLLKNISADFMATKHAELLQFTGEMKAGPANKLHIVGQLPTFDFSSTQPIKAKINLHSTDLGHYFHFSQITHLYSILDGEINITGKLNQPIFNGEALIDIRSAFLPDIGVTLSNALINLKSTYPQLIHFKGQFRTGKGEAQFNGTFNPYIATLPLKIQIVGKELTLINLPYYKIIGSPHLSLYRDNQATIVQGNLHIPTAKITSPTSANVVTLPPEAVVIKKKKTIIANTWPLKLELTITLGKDIHIAYENLSAYLEGKIDLHQVLGSPLTANGELITKNGKYTAYGKTLTIKHGRLIYSGNPVTNPGLDLLALRTIDSINMASNDLLLVDTKNNNVPSTYNGSKKIKVGVSVKGTLNNPIIDLLSEPTMNRTDILSYLVFGYPSTQATDLSSLALLSTLSNPTTKNKQSIYHSIESFKKKLNINKLEVGNINYFDASTNQMSNATSLNISKKIGKRLSINYSMGLFSPLSILGIRYQINKHYVLQSQTSNMDNGADIFYEIERD